jgi:hypothetical protein
MSLRFNLSIHFLTCEHEENPGSHFVCRLQAGEVELSYAHGHGVLDGAGEVPEVLHAVLQDEKEESGKAEKDDRKLNHERGEAGEAETNSSGNLS